MKDFIENMEDCAEKQYDEITKDVPAGYFKCYCGKITLLEMAQPMSSNPYSMPGCPDCFKDMMDEYKREQHQHRSTNLAYRVAHYLDKTLR